MKTAMQELLEKLQKSFDEKTYPISIDGTYFLEKEKEDLMMAFNDGKVNAVLNKINSTEYYNKNYNQNK